MKLRRMRQKRGLAADRLALVLRYSSVLDRDFSRIGEWL